MTEANRRGCGGVRAQGRVEEGPIRRDQRDLEIAPMWRRIRKLERRLVEARVASSNREDEEESDTADSSKVGVEGKVDVDDSDPFDGPPIYDVYPNDEADSDFVEPSPIYDNYGEVDQEEELEAAILLDDPTVSLNPDVDVGVVIGVSPGIIPNLVELGFLRKCFIQSDMKLWPSKIIPGPADKPVIVVDYKDEEKGYDENQKFDDVGGGGKNILVFDLGSGTFEVSILTIDNNGVFEVLAINGDTLLGGENFDQRVMEYFIKLIREKHTKNMKLSDDVDKEILTWIVMIGNVLHSTGCITIWIFDPGPYNVSDSRTNLFLEGENDAVWMRERANGLGKADSGLDSPICY